MMKWERLDHRLVKQFLEINEPYLRSIIEEPPKREKGEVGREPYRPRWVLAGLAILSRLFGYSWEQVPTKPFKYCHFLWTDNWLNKDQLPKKSTFHQIWDSIEFNPIRDWISFLGLEIALPRDDRIAGDSSGFYTGYGDLWRYAKWENAVTRAHPKFRKVHMGVSLPSTAIVTVCISDSKEHDNPHFSHLWQQTPTPLMKLVDRWYLDKAYWDEKIAGLIAQEGMWPVIPPKQDAVDHDLYAIDEIVRAHKKYPGLYKHNHNPEFRSAVEHSFGDIQIANNSFRVTDRKESNKRKTLLLPLLRYNFEIYVEEVMAG